MRKMNPHLFGLISFISALIILVASLVASYFLTAYIYRLFGIRLSVLLTQIINTLLGLIFSVLLVGSIGTLARIRGWVPEMNVFKPVVHALEQIAKGDFSIRLAETNHDNQMVSVLAGSVNKMALELEQMETLRQEFISNVSHEIQSPLTSIRGFAQALQNESLSEGDRRHYLEIITDESTRLSRITADLLALAALDSEHAKFTPLPYRLDKQLRSLVLACEPQWAAKDLELDVVLDEIEITADEDLLSQVWTNLIHNSIKFTPPGGKVRLDLHQQGEWITFKIQDTGIGIPPVDQPRIFERFYKVDQSRTRSNGGSGLGLAITRKIVELHHGEISLESQAGTGATFFVRLNSTILPQV